MMKCFKIFSIPTLFQLQKIPNYLVRAVHSNHISQTQNLPSSLPLSVVYEKKKAKFSNILLNFGFNESQVGRILNSTQSILDLREKDLSSSLINFQCTFEANDKIFTVLSSNPELLTLNPPFVQNRVKELMTIFTRKDINKLFFTCPKVFLDDFETLMEKVQYIVHNMKVEQKSIVKSYALQFSLDHIRYRHTFLSRAGRFKIEKKVIKSKNPPLYKIFSRNIETFLKLTNLTEEEYVAFCDAFEEEDYELEDSEEDSDDES